MKTHFWIFIFYLVFMEMACLIHGRNIEERRKIIRKRKPKSLGRGHHGFEMFSMMDFPSKKLKIYAADPIQRLLYSNKDLGQINGILTDKDVIDADHIIALEPQQPRDRELELNNLVSNEDQNPTPPPIKNRYFPSNNVGFTHHSVRASDIEFFNNAVEMTKPTKKQSSTQSLFTARNRRQFPVSKLSKDSLRKLMNRISSLLNEDVVRKPTKPVTKDCTEKKPSGKTAGKSEKLTESYSNTNEDTEMQQNIEQDTLQTGGQKQVVDTKKYNPDSKSKKPKSSESAATPSRPTNKFIKIDEDEESDEEENFIMNKLSGKQEKMTKFVVTSNTKSQTPSVAVKTQHEESKKATDSSGRTVALTTLATTTSKPATTTVVTTTAKQTTVSKTKQQNVNFKALPTRKQNKEPYRATTFPLTTRIVTITKNSKINKKKAVSKTVDRKNTNAVVSKPRIFKIREWRLPLFTVRKPCPLKADTLIRTRSNKVIAIDGTMMYIIGRTGVEVGPMPIKEFWPEVVGPINDAYIRPQDHATVVFFKGRYASYYSDKLLADGPNDAAALGIPKDMASFDAVSAWTGNRKTYFFKGSYYWRYNDGYHRFDYGYPRTIKQNWRGIPDNVDTAFIAPNQFMYFVKDGLIYKMEYYSARVRYRYPKRLFDSCYEFFM